MPRILLTGASGYIGGDILYSLAAKRPNVQIRALVRDAAKAQHISKQYPKVEIVQGDLDNTDLMEKESSQAEIVLNLAATAHLSSAQAIRKGLAQRSSSYWIQISGGTVLSQDEIKAKRFGEASTVITNDFDGVQSLKDQIRRHPNRAVDNYLLGLSSDVPHIRTATVFAPIIYGKGRGPVHQRSIQIPELSRIAIERGRAVHIGQGLNRWGNVHITDLSELFLLLVDSALSGNVDEKIWSKGGLYFAGSGSELTFGKIAKEIANAAKSYTLIPEAITESITAETADELSSHFSGIVGTNAREEAHRAKNVLGWQPGSETLEREIQRSVAEEGNIPLEDAR